MFKVIKKSKKSAARLGELKTLHGAIKTPFFMPIATRGSVKALTSNDLLNIGTEIILANTYHLFQRPGDKIIKKLNGLHGFMNWQRPILTDSGGYQVFSLSPLRKINLAGVEFRSEVDGQKIFLTPEKVLDIQKNFNSDIAMVLDYCVGYPSKKEEVKKAVEITTLWAKRSKRYAERTHFKNLIFGIIQGGIYKDLREKSLNELLMLDFDGYAIGGLAVGEPEKKMFEMIDFLIPHLPQNKPRYLMGVGYPEQIFKAILKGIDMFDCVIPTRHARHGELFVRKNKNILINNNLKYEIVEIGKSKYKESSKKLDLYCDCENCRNFSLAYLHHLYKNNELLYYRLATLHNLKFYLDLIREIRQAIKKNKI
ncbi:MAG: tRNA guanosine(34) transglycosylase Tgt [Minisyncoccia bacterium]